MKRWFPPTIIAIAVIVVCCLVIVSWRYKRERAEQARFERGETELIISNLARVPVKLFKAGRKPADARPFTSFNGERIWLPAGDYFLKAGYPSREVFYPAPIAGYRRGPDKDVSFVITIRTLPDEIPPSTSAIQGDWALIPSGAFLFGDRQNPLEPHYVWLPTFFIARFELTLNIYSHRLEGGKTPARDDLREINALNHYIGMRPLLESDFSEFVWIPFVIGALAVLALRAMVIGKMSNLVDVFAIFSYFGLFSFWSFYNRLYAYGHNLDPTAAIKVPAFTPPLIGRQVVGNFTVTSSPGAASFALLAFALLLLTAIFLSRKANQET